MSKSEKFWMFWLLALTLLGLLTSCNKGLKREIEMLREELAKQQQYVPLHKDTIRDSVELVTQKIIEVEKIKEVLTDEDRKLLKDAGIAAKELMSLQKTSTEANDTVWLEKKDSSENAPLYYKDAWAEFEYQNKKLRYSVKDSLAIAVKKEFKHRFLWWKWGTKGYDVKVMNFNPHATIRYNTFVKRKE
jgi:hypothetical protein